MTTDELIADHPPTRQFCKYTEDQLKILANRRAMDWNWWPAYLGAGLAPLLLIDVVTPLSLFITLLVINILWRFVKMPLLSASLVDHTFWLGKAFWVTVPITSVIYLIQHRHGIIFVLCWPFISYLSGFVGLGPVGPIETNLYLQMHGLDPREWIAE